MWTPADQVRAVRVPDIQPGGLPEGAGLSMVAGDFLEVYAGQDGAPDERWAWLGLEGWPAR